MKNHETPQAVEAVALPLCPFCGSAFKLGQEPHDNGRVAGMFYVYHDYGPIGSAARECRLEIRGHFDSREEAVAACSARAIPALSANTDQLDRNISLADDLRRLRNAYRAPDSGGAERFALRSHLVAHVDSIIEALTAITTPPPESNEHAELIARLRKLTMPNGDTLTCEYPDSKDWAHSWTSRDPQGRAATGEQDWEIVERYGLTAILNAVADALQALSVASPGEVAFDAIVGIRRRKRRIDSLGELLRLINGGAALNNVTIARTTLDQG